MLDKVMEELKRLHGDKLDFEQHHYFLFFEDGVFDVYFDEDEKTLMVDATFSDGIKVYHSKESLGDLLTENS